MQRPPLALVLALVAALSVAVIGVTVVQNQGYFPPPPTLPFVAQSARPTATFRLADASLADNDQLAAWVDQGPGVDPIILFVGTDPATAKTLAQNWVAANHPGARIMYLPPQGHGPPIAPPTK